MSDANSSTQQLAYDPSAIAGLVAAAPEAGYSPLRFGRLTMTPSVLTWSDDGGVRVPHRTPYTGGALPKGGTLEFNFVVDLKEFSPNLSFDYERAITVRKSRRSGERITEPTDWSEIVEPSLIKVFGKNWPVELLKAPYVVVDDTPNAAGRVSKKSQKMYGVPKFIKRFASRDEAYAAFKEALPGGENASGDELAHTQGGVPANVLQDIVELVAANGVDSVRTLLEAQPYGNYAPDDLLKAAGVIS